MGSKSIREKEPAERQLIDLRGVGKSILGDLHELGITRVEELARQDGEELYNRLCNLHGERQDPCVLDVFNSAIAQARDPDLPAELRDWWTWSRIRKGELEPPEKI